MSGARSEVFGTGRGHAGLRHLLVTHGSFNELETYLLIMVGLYVPLDEVKQGLDLAWEMDRMLSGFAKKVEGLPSAA